MSSLKVTFFLACQLRAKLRFTLVIKINVNVLLQPRVARPHGFGCFRNFVSCF